MEQITIDPPKDPINGHYITNPIPVEFEFVGPGVRIQYNFKDCDEHPVEVTGKNIPTASENMLAALVNYYKSSVENSDADNKREIISELEGFIEAFPPDGE